MTPRERADALFSSLWMGGRVVAGEDRELVISAIEGAIVAAVAEEREACALAVLDACHERVEDSHPAVSFATQDAVALGVAAIRARGGEG